MRDARGVQEIDHVIGKLGGGLSRLRRRMNDDVKRIARDLKADVVTAFVYDQKTARFHLPVGHGLWDPATFKDPRLGPRSRRVAGVIAREGRPIIVNQVDPLSPMDGPFARREGIRSAAGFPLQHRGATVGVLFVSFRQAHTFGGWQEKMIRAGAARMAKVIAAAAAWEELSRLPEPKWRRDNSALRGIVELACDSLNLSVAIWQLQVDGKTLALVAGTGLTRSYVDQAEMRVGDGSWLSRIVDGDGVTAPVPRNLRGDRRSPSKKAAASWAAALCFPVCCQGCVYGVIEGLSFDPEISPSDQDVLRRLADLAGRIIENTRRECEARILDKILHALSQALDFNRAVQMIVDGALELTGADSGCMYQFDENNNPFVLYSKPNGVPVPTTCILPQALPRGDQPKEQEGAKVPSQIEMPIKAKQDWIGTLYVSSQSPRVFTDHHKHLLRTLADQAALVWGPPQFLLLDASKAIGEASTRVVEQQQWFEGIINQIGGPYDFAALQLINPEERVIETVRGIGLAAKWDGLAKHYLEKDTRLRDIQVDIALARPPRAEIIARYDSRFDKWIYETFEQKNLVRAFVPMILVRDTDGRVLEGKRLDDWLQTWGTDEWKVENQPDGQPEGERQFVELKSLAFSARRRKLSWEIIGTVEVGYDLRGGKTIDRQQVVELVKRAAQHAVDCYRTLVQNVFQAVADHAVRIVGAKYAILHFGQVGTSADSERISYVYQVSSGQVAKSLLKHHPRKMGLGQQAILEREPQFVPDSFQDAEELSRTNPGIYSAGVRSIAAIPLLVEPKGKGRLCLLEVEATKFRQGVLYVGFGHEARDGANGVHRFTPEEIGWLRLFVDSAADAIRHATSYTHVREQARLLANLHSVAESLVNNLQTEDSENPERSGHANASTAPNDEKHGAGRLLRHIAGSALNILGADVVTIYEYLESEETFLSDPDRAGRLYHSGTMGTEVGEQDAPSLIVKKCKEEGISAYYAPDSAADPILNPIKRLRPPRKRESFVEREKIKSSAGILLVAGPGVGRRTERGIVGVMFINYRRPNRFPEAEQRLIETLASSAAVAIKNRRLLEAVIASHLLEAVIASGRELLAAQTAEVFTHIVERARVLTGAQVGELLLVAPITGELQSRVLSPLGESSGPTARLRRTFAWQVLENADATLNQNFGNDGSALGVPLTDGKGAVLGVLAVFNSRPHAFHLRNRTLLDALAVPVVLALHIDEAQKRLKMSEKLSTLGSLAGPLLHRLDSDLRGIRRLADLLKDARDPALIRTAAENMASVAKAYIKQIPRMSDWSNEVRQPVIFVDAVRRAVKLVAMPAGISFVKDVPSDLPPVYGDARLLAEVFGILFKNAAEAMPAGGELKVQARCQAYPDANRVVIRVRDEGSGIDAETKKRLFQPICSSKKGLGIGLCLAQSYIVLLGGILDLEWTKPGQGSTFVIVLPAGDRSAHRASGGPRRSSSTTGPDSQRRKVE
jgi:GAF domain-containing protein